ncbi:MAG: ThuA domain-containing protein [Planctomycetota bacterium]|jgi:nicotinamidase-related amidase/type 1 glutamine amidotransferase
MIQRLVCKSLAFTLLAFHATAAGNAADSELQLTLRSKQATAPQSGRFHTVNRSETWAGSETAVIVCDMWDLHHCLNATRRGAEMAPRMNRVLSEARRRGAIVIHAPSGCMDTYRNHPARLRATATERSENLPQDIGAWCYQIPSEEQGEYPIDQSDGGEDDDPQEHAEWAKQLAAMGRNPKAPWKSQTDLLSIDTERDFISDNGEEIWSILEKHNRQNVILVGVHTNMCVLGRPFGLRQLSKNGKNVVLMRDMTDTMYNPKMRPFVSHFTGTDLIIDHIEKWVCPTVTSDQLLGGRAFVFRNDARKHCVIVMAEREYRTNESLPKFALEHLGHDFRVSYVFAREEERNDLPGIDVLADADVLLLSVRRRVLPPEQMAVVRKFIESGKPIVGIRTANHAFSLRGKTPPEGLVAWETWDADIFGGSYTNHYGNGPKVVPSIATGASGHAILTGVDLESLRGIGSLYVVNPLADSTTPLLHGAIPDKPAETIAWTNKTTFGGKSFYTSLGHVGDFEQPAFQQLLKNSLLWAVSDAK